MKKLFICLLFSFFFFSFNIENDCTDSLMLGYKLDFSISELFNKISIDPQFKVLTSDSEFKNKGEFTAKYLPKSNVYPNADSIYFDIYKVDGTGADSKQKINLKAFSITEYIDHKTTIKQELKRLKKTVCKGINFIREKFNDSDDYIETASLNSSSYSALEIEWYKNQITIIIIDIEK